MSFIKNVKNFNFGLNLNIHCINCYFDSNVYDDALYQALKVFSPSVISHAVKKRKAEFLVGRYLCKILLENMKQPTDVRIGKHRQPQWPDGWIGSITHTKNKACSCIASKTALFFLGIDLEIWIDQAIAEKIVDKIVDWKELNLLLQIMSFYQAITFAFSAKESFFKAVYPAVGYYFDFNCVRFSYIDLSTYSFKLSVVTDLSAYVVSGKIFNGQFRFEKEGVFTAIMENL